MSSSIYKRARSVATLGIVAAVVVGGVAAAQGGSGGKSHNGHSGPPRGKRMPPPPGGPLGGPAGKDLTYAQLHVQRNGEAQVIRLDRGKITAVSGTSITVEENDGSEVTIAVDEDTKVLAGPRQDKSVSDLETGRQVVVCGPEGGTAKAIMLPPPKGGKHGRHLPPPLPGGSQGGPPQMQG
ncbi:MAG: hypothetical protein ACM3N0_02210 [Chloroflexota bacterium]